MRKFYLTENAAKAVEVGGKKFVLEAAEYFAPTGTYWGTLATEDENDMALLDEAVSKGLIQAITEDDFDKLEVKKKKPYVSPSLIALKPWHAPQMDGPKVAAPAVTDKEIELETVADALEARPAAKTKGKK